MKLCAKLIFSMADTVLIILYRKLLLNMFYWNNVLGGFIIYRNKLDSLVLILQMALLDLFKFGRYVSSVILIYKFTLNTYLNQAIVIEIQSYMFSVYNII